MSGSRRPHRWSVIALVGVLVAGCAGGDPGEPPPPDADSTPATGTGPDGRTPSGVIGHEFEGDAEPPTTLWAQVYETRAGEPFKSIWRMTGDGDLSIHATGPGGRTVEPQWGPEAHDGSNWDRPGDEWGAGWKIPRAGVWTFHVDRTDGASGTLAVRFR